MKPVALLAAGVLLPACATLPSAVDGPRFEETPILGRAEWIERVAEAPDAEIDLVEAATVLASHAGGSRRSSSEIPRFLHPVLDRVRRRAGPGASPDATLDALNEELPPAMRRGEAGDLRWLFSTLGHNQGGCVATSLLYLVAGDALGLGLEPVVIPTHVFVCLRTDGRRRNIETTDRGRAMSAEEYRKFLLQDPTSLHQLPQSPEALEKALEPIPRRHFVAIMACQGVRHLTAADLREASRLAPAFWLPWSKLGGLHATEEDYRRAEECASEAIARAAHLPVPYAARAHAQVLLGKPNHALLDIDAALRLAPEVPRYHHIRFLICFTMGRYEDSLAAQTRAVEGAPRSAEYRHFRAVALEKLGRVREAVEEWTAAIDLDPRPNYVERRAKARSLTGDRDP